jgi:hypothetical protein
MTRCEQCGETIVWGEKSLSGYKFCSNKCIETARRSGLKETQEEFDAQLSNPVIPLLAAAHALLPLLLIYISIAGPKSSLLANIGVIFFWSWVIWIWPLIGSRDSKLPSYKISLVFSIVALLIAALPAMFFTIVALDIRVHI